MCGIVGYVGSSEGNAARWLSSACDSMVHRGPDAKGAWQDEFCGLGHRRLSIIALSTGAQPMSYGEGRYWIVFNGEIYNYRELKSHLIGYGHRFRTDSDTEVILAAYAQWGRAAPARLRGIFAFAIWDRLERSLALARDHFGVKPLLYSDRPGELLFGSELKGILGADRAWDIDPNAVSDYLALGYVLGSKTIVRGIRRLEPGTILFWRDGRCCIQPYYDLAPAAQDVRPMDRSIDEYTREYRERLEDAVTTQMVSDVPVGAFLSGGLDSSSVAHFMCRATGRQVRTFSMGFVEPSFSELPYAAQAAAALGTNHRADVVTADLTTNLGALVRQFDEPLGDTSIIPTYFLSHLASRHVKVVLSGDGADETLAGYDTYVADLLHRWCQWVPRGARHRLARPLGGLIPHSRRKVSLNYKLKQFIAQMPNDPRRAHYGWRLLFPDDVRFALLAGASHDHDPFTEYSSYFDHVPEAPALNKALYVDMKTWLANDILVKVDRASMSVGLEARVPFLDPQLVEYCLRLPIRLKMDGFARKVVLRRAMRGLVPEAVLKRRKSGFNAPVSDWLRGGLRAMVEDLLRTESSIVDVRSPRVHRAWQEHLAGHADHGFCLWALFVLLLWEHVVWRPAVKRVRAVAPPRD